MLEVNKPEPLDMRRSGIERDRIFATGRTWYGAPMAELTKFYPEDGDGIQKLIKIGNWYSEFYLDGYPVTLILCCQFTPELVKEMDWFDFCSVDDGKFRYKFHNSYRLFIQIFDVEKYGKI